MHFQRFIEINTCHKKAALPVMVEAQPGRRGADGLLLEGEWP